MTHGTADDLFKVAAEVRACQLCGLATGRRNAVPGEGPLHADVMFIGEGPGLNEDKQGRPFVGASGQFLTQLIARAGLTREDVFIANVVKCRPLDNRDPLPEEIIACHGYLERQITLVNPKIIVTLGRFSMASYFPGMRISTIHGQSKRLPNGRLVVAMFHPAAALHNAGLRPTLEQDFTGLKTLLDLEKVLNARQRPAADDDKSTPNGQRNFLG